MRASKWSDLRAAVHAMLPLDPALKWVCDSPQVAATARTMVLQLSIKGVHTIVRGSTLYVVKLDHD